MARRSRFKRVAPEPLRLTDDDLTIIRHIARHRFLRSTHLLQLMPGRSPKKLIERLGALYHNGYTDRPRAQLDYYGTAGSAPMVHALGNRGAQALAEHDGLDRGQIDWTWKNRSVGRLFIEHTLLTADAMVATHCAVASRHDVRLMGPEEILARAPEATRRASHPFRLSTRTQHEGRIVDVAVIPDAVFGLDFTVERQRKYFFLEADRATMPIVRKDFDQTSYLRKLVAYLAGGGPANAFGAHFGIGNFRVLTITTSRERMATMIDALKQLTRGAGTAQFLFVDRATLHDCRDLLSLEWISGKGERVTLGE
jgi:Replication-relaxation